VYGTPAEQVPAPPSSPKPPELLPEPMPELEELPVPELPEVLLEPMPELEELPVPALPELDVPELDVDPAPPLSLVSPRTLPPHPTVIAARSQRPARALVIRAD
jgi:hypothetical protein